MTSCRDIGCKHYALEGRNWTRTCTKHDLCSLEARSAMPSLEYRLCKAREMMSRDEGTCTIVASQMKNWPEVAMVDLDDLAWACAQDSYLHKNDVIGMIELFEERWKERMS